MDTWLAHHGHGVSVYMQLCWYSLHSATEASPPDQTWPQTGHLNKTRQNRDSRKILISRIKFLTHQELKNVNRCYNAVNSCRCWAVSRGRWLTSQMSLIKLGDGRWATTHRATAWRLSWTVARGRFSKQTFMIDLNSDIKAVNRCDEDCSLRMSTFTDPEYQLKFLSLRISVCADSISCMLWHAASLSFI